MMKIAYICAVILSLFLYSCKSRTDRFGIDGSLVEDEYEYEEDGIDDDSYTLIPVIRDGEGDNEGYVLIDGIALRKSSGEYLMFDNDADYSYLTPYLIKAAYIDATEANVYHHGKIEESKLDELISKFNKRYSAVSLYLDGRKSEIEDRQLAERIDRSYYNGLKTLTNYYEKSSEYNRKVYADENGKKQRSVKPFRAVNRIPEGAPKIPEGALYID